MFVRTGLCDGSRIKRPCIMDMSMGEYVAAKSTYFSRSSKSN